MSFLLYDEEATTGSVRYVFYNPKEATITLKDIPVGTTYEIIPPNNEVKSNNSTTYVEYYTTDDETGVISDGDNVVNYTIKPKYLKFDVIYPNIAPDYDTPDVVFDLTFHAYSVIPDTIYYYNSSNPNEILEMEKVVYFDGMVDFKIQSGHLKRGESIIIEDAPVGVQYYTTPRGIDPNYLGYRVKYSQSQSGQISQDLDYYYFVECDGNAYEPKKLTITKEKNGNGIDLDKEFTFKLIGSAYQHDGGNFGKLNATYLYEVIDCDSGEVVETKEVDFDDGVGYVQCKAGQRIELGTVKDLQDVAYYRYNSIRFGKQAF